MTSRKKIPSSAAQHSTKRQLAKYREKRDFGLTPEPSGDAGKSGHSHKPGKLAFVIQKHAATQLHYDFRLEWDGVLKSWAVAKGPSYYPGDKRLAIQVEDHPLEYGGFEGIIPKGQYGGGTVMLWDRGTWEPVGDAAEGLRDGNLKFALHGEKLHGHWVLVRMKGKFANQSKPSWLLIKEHDGEERTVDGVPITEEAPDSVLSGRDIDAIAKAHDVVWGSRAGPLGDGISSKGVETNPTVRLPKSKSQPALRKSAGAANASAGQATLSIRLTHPDKLLDAESGLTKDGLAHYYDAIAPYMLPHIVDRPLSLVRCMNGTGKPCFFQKHANETLPPEVESIDIVDKKTGKPEPYITLSTSEALVELAQISVLEIHCWGSKNDSLEKPDRIVIDLDPDEAIDWKTLASAAIEVRERMKSAGLESFLKTTGGKGLHVVAPIRPEHDWAAVKDFAHRMMLAMEADNPSLFLTRMTKAARKGKIYLDYLRNERGATAIAPYSPRARSGASVALPLNWSELKSNERPVFRVSDFSEWKARLRRDPWEEMPKTASHLNI